MTKKPKETKAKNYLRLRDPKDNLDFGRLIAEQDDNLAQYYVAQDKYLRRASDVNDPAVFFVGPKGIGKSAILQMVRITRLSEANRIINIRPDDLAFSALANVEATSAVLSDAGKNQWLFKALWDYVIALEIFRREYPDTNALSGWFSKMLQGKYEKEARKLVAMSEGNAVSLTTRMLQLISEVEVSGEYAGAKGSATVKLDHSKGKPTEAFQLLGLVSYVAKEIPNNLRHTYYVLIDDLDLYWSDTPIQNSFIAALFTTLRHFSRPPNIKAVVALRQNIYSALPLVDRDKFPDAVCKVMWDHDAVKTMIEERVVFKLSVSKPEVWGHVFPANAFELMWTNSNGRPREAIRIATIAAETAVREGHLQITDDDMAKALKEFSGERILEITEEHRFRYPGLGPIVRRMSGWPKEFKYPKLKDLLDTLVLEAKIEEPGSERYPWIVNFESNGIGFADILLQTGILWIKRSHSDDAQPFDDRDRIEITNETWLAIHPMFGPGLGLKGA